MLLLKKTRVDLRVYTFFGKVLFVYPRRNRSDAITTNISQGAKGDLVLLKKLPRHLVKKAKKLATDVSGALGVNLIGMDIMMDRNLKDVYVIDVNFFPGLPKRRTFNISQRMIEELIKLNRKSGIRYEKMYSI